MLLFDRMGAILYEKYKYLSKSAEEFINTMKLEISIIKYRGAPPSNKQDFIFNQEGGSIGRSEDNAWILPDERNFLSRVQASIIFQNEKFYLIDKSSNGCFINQSSTPIGKGISHALNDNDIIRMGEYELRANYINQTDIDEDESSFDLFSPNSSTTFPSNDISQTDIASDDPFKDVFRPKYENEDNYIKPEVDSSFNSATPIDIPELEKETSTTVNNTEETPSTLSPETPPPRKKKSPQFVQEKEPDDIDSFFNDTVDKTKDDPFMTSIVNEEDITDVKKEKVGFTQIFAGQDILKDEDDFSPFETPKPEPIVNTASQPYSEKANIDKVVNEDEMKTIDLDKLEQNNFVDSPPTTIRDKATAKEIRPSNEKDNLLFEEIFKAAGINTQKITIKPTKETAIIIGQVLQEALQGTMELLRSRAETKDVFRVGDKTIISIARNNPLKFLPTAEHVITQLIIANDNDNLAYTPLVEAVQESFDDLKAHQFALSMSIQEALSATIKDYFSPQNLQEKLERSGAISSVLPWQKKANLWKLFEEAYDGIEEEASEQFQLVLERKIANAYEAHMHQIKQQRL